MLRSLLRKVLQLASDPVLRRWMVLRALRATPGEPPYEAGRPPYLGEGWTGLESEIPRADFPALAEGPPRGAITLKLAGGALAVEPGGEAQAMAATFGDTETMLSLHRFAWVPLMESGDDPRWVGVLWRAWHAVHGTPGDSWAWHPYTAAERAINLLDFIGRHGLPDPAAEVLAGLAAHGPAIARSLEYFGDHHTSNHLANNGRGLYLLGLALGLPACADLGAHILTEEAARIFRPSGVLREGSTHYHLLLTRSWASIWLAAQAHGRPEAARFAQVLDGTLAVLPHFALAGRFPLVGDVSPDCPPAHLSCLLPGGDRDSGWMGLLAPADRALLAERLDRVVPVRDETLAADGWRRAAFGEWDGLWHADPEGFSHMPGHGHQDCGGFELHHGGLPLFIDPGRGSYAIAGEAEETVSARAHNGISVDGADPFAPNKPYYAAPFRRTLAGDPPLLRLLEDGIALEFHGFSRLGKVGEVERRWRFEDGALTLADEVEGRGTHLVTRRLHTTLAVERIQVGLLLSAPDGRRFILRVDGAEIAVRPVTSWTAYGEGETARRIEISLVANLPWRGSLRVEVA